MLSRSKPVQIMRCLTRKEVQEFEAYLALFAQKSVEPLKTLVKWFMKFHPDFDQAGFTREKLLELWSGDKPLNEERLRYLLSDLTGALEQYVMFKKLRDDPQRSALALLEFYKENDLEKFFNQEFEALRQNLEKSANRSTDYHLINYLACDHRYAFHLRKQQEGLDEELQAISDHLDSYYIIVRLRIFSEMLTREMLLQVNYDKPLLPVLLEMAEREPYASDPVVGVYRTVVLMHREPDNEEHYHALMRFIDASVHLLPKPELNDVLVFAQNYCTSKINKGREEFLEEIWRVYQRMMQYDVIYEGEYVRPGLFKNMVTVGVRWNKLEETEEIVNRLSRRLDPRLAEGVLA